MLNVVLHADADRIRLVAEDLPPADPLGVNERAEFDVEICPSPLCGCRDVRFVERVAAEPGARRQLREFVLDPFMQCPAEPSASDTPESERLAREVAGSLSDEAWQRLVSLFMNVKARAIAEIDCERERAVFPFAEIELDGAMVSYRQTIPFDREILVTAGTRELLVDEQHCVRRDCDCANVILVLHEVGPTRGSGRKRAAREVAAMLVDHRLDRWLDADTGGKLSAEGLELHRLLVAQHPQLLARLGRQQAVLRDLYRSAAAAVGLPTGRPAGLPAGLPTSAPAQPLVAAPRVGRNDPCPCGSGKKYKRCCLPGA